VGILVGAPLSWLAWWIQCCRTSASKPSVPVDRLPEYGKAANAEAKRQHAFTFGAVRLWWLFWPILLFSCNRPSNVLALPALTDVFRVMLLCFSRIHAGIWW